MIPEALKKFYQLFKDSLPDDKKAEAGTLIEELSKEDAKDVSKKTEPMTPPATQTGAPSANGAAAIDDAWQKEKAAYDARIKALEERYENDRKTEREAAADEFVKKHVTGLRIPADNDAAKKNARSLYLADPAAAESIISQLTPAKPIIQIDKQKTADAGAGGIAKDTMQSLREHAIASIE